ncbi:hypothetical protein SBRCBS47491_001883 [Sporothrix bragantina]|uniref:Rhodopsin domain-containing protein n=1 Tax=Sporothrix bragantina TaxID=671064 RepID=A0ABP0B2D4_9PEZI
MVSQDVHHAPFVESRATLVIVVAVVFAVLSLGMLLLRLYLRCRILKATGLDDWTMLVAQILALAVSAMTVVETRYGLGRHLKDVSPENEVNQLTYLYINVILYNLTMNVIKISFLLQYDRIFQADGIRTVCFGMMIFVVVWAIVQGLLLGLACVPLSLLLPTTARWCLPTLPVWYASAAVHMVTDAIIFLVPLPSVVRLQLPLRQKLAVLSIFCLGFGVCVISVVRALTLHAAADVHDPTWNNTNTAVWSVVEMHCAILCSSVPTLRPLIMRTRSGIKSTLSRTTTTLRGHSRSRSRSLSKSHSRSRSRSRAVNTPRTVDIEAGRLQHDPMPELHLVDLEALARGLGPSISEALEARSQVVTKGPGKVAS